MTINDWLEESTPDRREIPTCFDRRLVSALVAAKQGLRELENEDPGMLGGSDELKAAAAAVTALEDQVRAKTRTLVFEGIGWGPWRDLLAKHPPQPDQLETFKRAVELLFMPHALENLTFNAPTFVPAAIVASCTSPGISEVEAGRLLATAPPGVIERIWAAVLDVNTAGNADPFVAPALPAS